ncbi:MAG: Collagen triple helix repeat protein [Solirubrobacterales bacterium]|nr:Collagen triple helix repeat protein [Solirubrobacterales bacterium]
MSKLRNRLTFANVVSMVALFVALGGSSYAAVTITGKQIKDSSITTKDIKDGSLLTRDFKPGQLPRGVAGPQGPAGAAGRDGAIGPAGPAGVNGTNGVNGQDGATGPRGPSDAYVSGNVAPQSDSNSASVTVPAGDYVAAASGQVLYFKDDSTFPVSEGEATCSLTSAGDAPHNTGTFATVPSHGFSSGTQRGGSTTVSQNSAFHLAPGGTITYTCSNASAGTQDGAATMQYSNMRVTAIQVGALH